MRHVGSIQFQSEVTGLTLCSDGAQLTLPRPRGFDSLFLHAEHFKPAGRVRGGERLVCHAGEVSITATAHASQRAARIDVVRRGKQRYNPLLARKPQELAGELKG